VTTLPDQTLTIDSPIGPIVVDVADNAVVAIHLLGNRKAPVSRSSDHPLLRVAASQIEDYFLARRQAFDLPIMLHGTPFRRRTWQALARIPFGQTRSYGDIASEIGSAARAVGGACGANPITLVIPCHRVVAAGGGLGGFSGGTGCDTKQWLLQHEQNML